MRRFLRILLNAGTALSLLLFATATVTRVLYNVVPVETGGGGGLFVGGKIREHPYEYDALWFEGKLIATRETAGQFQADQRAYREFEWLGMTYRHWERDESDSVTMEGEPVPSQRGDELCVPYWQISVATLLLPAVRAIAFLGRRRVRRNRRRQGRCIVCGYDLRATADRCPECGHAPTAEGRAPAPEGGRR